MSSEIKPKKRGPGRPVGWTKKGGGQVIRWVGLYPGEYAVVRKIVEEAGVSEMSWLRECVLERLKRSRLLKF